MAKRINPFFRFAIIAVTLSIPLHFIIEFLQIKLFGGVPGAFIIGIGILSAGIMFIKESKIKANSVLLMGLALELIGVSTISMSYLVAEANGLLFLITGATLFIGIVGVLIAGLINK